MTVTRDSDPARPATPASPETSAHRESPIGPESSAEADYPPGRSQLSDPEYYSGPELARLYENRFTAAELAGKRELWTALCRGFLDRYVGPDDTVLDLAAGTCEFSNACRAGRKIAVDLNPDTARYATDAEVVLAPADNMAPVASGTVDVVFTSNFFEHLPDKRTLLRTLRECHRVLRPGGRLLVLMPNLRYVGQRYWDYLDHHLPLTHHSLVEGLRLTGFHPDEVIPRFLPYTVKDSPVRVRGGLVRLYLRLRPAWRLLGRQMFVAASKPGR
ncbi:class I SAM-dependent methyltransferase [Micromonospora sp. NPDC049559]|uniref:class I SAM-dependent methyltransferase n=1 Tax=Micromonospora sp. NPDC049559 TaxID=3155923 RepID=UPI003428AFE2